MITLASIPNWFLRLIGAKPNSETSEVWFRFEGMDPGWALLLGILFGTLIFFLYSRNSGGLSRAKSIALAMIRSLLLLLILAILTQPVIRVVEQKQTKGTLLVLQDVSASMELRDQRLTEIEQERVRLAFGPTGNLDDGAAPTRSALVQAVAANPELNLWPRIAERVNILLVPFGGGAGNLRFIRENGSKEITPAEAEAFFGNLDYTSPLTAIADSLAEALEEARSHPLVGILLITDGANNMGEPLISVPDKLEGRELPLYVYAVGVTGQRDLQVVSFSGPASAFLDETAILSARLRVTDLAGETAEVRLLADGETVDRREVAFEQDGEVDISFSFIPKTRGENHLSLAVEEIEGEATPENNQANLTLHAQKRGVRVLIIEQEPRWDFRYLMDTLKRDKRIDVSAVMLDGDATLGRDPQSDFLKELPSPEELLEYLIVVIGDVDPERLSDEHMDALARIVRETGGGLVFLAGSDYNPSSYGGTELESLLPVLIGPAAEKQDERYDSLKPLFLTYEGSQYPVLKLNPDPAENERIWRDFPGVRWTAKTGPAKPAAKVLLVDPNAPEVSDGKPQPVLAQMSVGRGQVFYFGIDETWRWRSRIGEKHYLKIWGQVFLNLGVERMKGASEYQQLKTARKNYVVGHTIQVYGRIFDASFQLLEEPELPATLTIEPVSDHTEEVVEREVTLSSRPGVPGEYELRLQAKTPGRYSIRTELYRDAPLGFHVEASNLELLDPALNLEGLRRLTKNNGRLYREENLSDLPNAFLEKMPALRNVKKYEPAFHPLVYALILILLITEWASRRLFKLK